jgi:predicted CoA-substrate-specific enzyme activase
VALFTIGLDIGSTASKCVILRDGKEIAGTALVPYGAGTSGPARAVRDALDGGGRTQEEIACTLATGYGRNSAGIADCELSELTCHAQGAAHLFPDVRTVIDIGGQDIKVLRVGEGGTLQNFVMNEKCAAGTGRFLEVMARILEIRIEDMAGLASESTQRVDISSTCTVFAESEVISQLSQNKDKRDILHGVHRSVAGRAAGLVRRVGAVPRVVMTGGVARNDGVLQALQEELGEELFTSPFAQYAGALGAALRAFLKMSALQAQDCNP